MSVTTLIILLATGIAAVTAVDKFPHWHTSVTSCCDFRPNYFFTFGRNTNTKAPSGIYSLHKFCENNSVEAFAFCDNCKGGGGWLVILRRQDRSIDFNRTWLEYEDGFGKLTREFWYGLKALNCLTGQGSWEMRMDIKLANGTDIFLQYEQFKIASAKDKYKLTVGGFQGTTTDPMAYHNGMNFTTRNSDNDQWSKNCALWSGPGGGWWYKSCAHIQPNIQYKGTLGIILNNNCKWYTLPFIAIKIRPHM